MSYYIHFENELSIHTGLVKHVILWDSIHSLWAQLRSSFQRLQPLLGSIILAWLCTRNKWILASWHSDAWEHQFLCSGGMWWISRTAGRGGVLMLKVAEVWAPSRERSLGQCSLEIGALSYACWALGSFCMCGLFFTWVWVGNRVQKWWRWPGRAKPPMGCWSLVDAPGCENALQAELLCAKMWCPQTSV